MTEIERFLLDLTRMTSLEAVWTAHQDRMAGYGFDRIMYAATRFKTDNGMGDMRDALVLTNYPADFTETYLEGGLFRDAPLVRWATRNVGSLSWTAILEDAKAGRLSQAELRVMEFNKRHGVNAGYGISFPSVSPRTAHGIGLASTQMNQAEVDALWQEKGPEIELLNHVAHLTILSLPYGEHGRPLTDRQREVLELVADGKTVGDAAMIMELTPATVEKHLRLAREALDVETTAQAIMKATAQNQFFHYDADKGLRG
ncbi:LuxR family transcriptional regulator [Jannaschia ovalis]|uniref:LuxR family transcriptional regulator n=1 Tax=Jannaschia ovalis TaxID=3038773 RepID=A0ABY8LBH1_9RHOB|nr:LuxR family transcriptional regulator [Jannaschia sp. GRR-S6-38]WGH78685.1 LuxR family transcriptional regulator [Jannaschia sp. GRR-S6-38]